MVPSPSKPTRNFDDSSNKDLSKVDDWESKLYGKQLEIGSTDSLKRRSWENSRVPFIVQEQAQEPTEKTIIEENEDKTSFTMSTTAPVTPSFAERRQQRIAQELEDTPKPKPLPRVNTVADASMAYDKNEKQKSPELSLKSEKTEKVEKPEKPEKDNIFSKKLKYFRKDSPHKTGSTENLRSSNLFNKSNNTSIFKNQVNEKRIIIGDENGTIEINGSRISKEIQAKYDGKSKEVIN